MKLAIAGGHLTPALALIDHILTQPQPPELVFIGRRHSQRQGNQLAHESGEVSQRGVPFVAYDAPRWYRPSLVEGLSWPAMMAAAAIRAWLVMRRHHPDVLISFGGYLAVPLAIAAWLRSVPIVTHEQTIVAGSANRFIAKLAARVAVAFPEAAGAFPAHKTTVTGNPVRTSILNPSRAKPDWLPAKHKPVVLITGGNQGSLTLNTAVMRALPQLVAKFLVVHACGNSTTQTDYQAELEQARLKLKPAHRQSYVVQPWFGGDELSWLYRHAKVVITRSGANTIWELLITKAPAVLIPLPYAKHDEQLANAKYLVDRKAARLLPQKNLSAEALTEAALDVATHHNSIKRHLRNIDTLVDGSARLHQVVIEAATN